MALGAATIEREGCSATFTWKPGRGVKGSHVFWVRRPYVYPACFSCSRACLRSVVCSMLLIRVMIVLDQKHSVVLLIVERAIGLLRRCGIASIVV
jgi:hypothetical protein